MRNIEYTMIHEDEINNRFYVLATENRQVVRGKRTFTRLFYWKVIDCPTKESAEAARRLLRGRY